MKFSVTKPAAAVEQCQVKSRKSLLTTPDNVLPLHLEQPFLPMI